MTLQISAAPGVGPQQYSRLSTSKRLRSGWQKGFYKEIAESLGVTLGSLQVTCSRLGISLRRRDVSNAGDLGTPRTVRRPYLPNRPLIAGQGRAGTGVH